MDKDTVYVKLNQSEVSSPQLSSGPLSLRSEITCLDGLHRKKVISIKYLRFRNAWALHTPRHMTE